MKAVIFILWLIAAMAALCAITGANVISGLGSSGADVLLNRMTSSVTAIYCGAAAYACLKRRSYGWWMVTILWTLVLVGVLTGAVWKAKHIGLPLPGLLLGGVGELVKLGLGGVLLVRVWLPMRAKFNRSTENLSKDRATLER